MQIHRSTLNKNEIEVVINISQLQLKGILSTIPNAKSIVAFAHGSGSSRHSVRNNFVARELQKAGMATFLMDLLTEEEEEDRGNVFDVQLLAQRLISAKAWLSQQSATSQLPVGYFGASTGAGAALVAAAIDPENIFAVVSRGGRPDLAASKLSQVTSPTLLLVGDLDSMVIDLNREAYEKLKCEKKMELIPGASHLFEEPGTLQQVARLATNWFTSHTPSVRRKVSKQKWELGKHP